MDSSLLGIVAALAGGATGNIIGKSPITGPQPVNKVLAPIGAILAPLLLRKVAGIEISDQEVLALAATASGGYSWAKNAYQLVKSIFKKEK